MAKYTHSRGCVTVAGSTVCASKLSGGVSHRLAHRVTLMMALTATSATRGGVVVAGAHSPANSDHSRVPVQSTAPFSFECTMAEYCTGPCPDNTTQTLMAGSERSLMGNSTGEMQLQSSVRHMVDVVQAKFGNVSNNVEHGLHLSFQYLCCYNQSQLDAIFNVLANVTWHPVHVKFSRVGCAASMALALADPASQGALFGVVAAFEEAIAGSGIPVHRYRAEQAPFHASLFNARPSPNDDMRDVIAVAQSTVPEGGLNTDPIVVDSISFNGKTLYATPLPLS
eukprot:m.186809 g.186809  ORF g.186809 m.186809 type:complete len:282 (-) comp16879_c0_seq1:165-1010(-)